MDDDGTDWSLDTAKIDCIGRRVTEIWRWSAAPYGDFYDDDDDAFDENVGKGGKGKGKGPGGKGKGKSCGKGDGKGKSCGKGDGKGKKDDDDPFRTIDFDQVNKISGT